MFTGIILFCAVEAGAFNEDKCLAVSNPNLFESKTICGNNIKEYVKTLPQGKQINGDLFMPKDLYCHNWKKYPQA